MKYNVSKKILEKLDKIITHDMNKVKYIIESGPEFPCHLPHSKHCTIKDLQVNDVAEITPCLYSVTNLIL